MARKAIILGANETGLSLAKILLRNGFEVHIIDFDEKRCERAKKLPVFVYKVENNELSIFRVMENIGLDDTEVLMTVTESDDLNYTVGSHARARGVPIIISVLYDKEREHDFLVYGIQTVAVGDALAPRLAKLMEIHYKEILYSDKRVAMALVLPILDSPYIGRKVTEVESECNVSVPYLIRDGKLLRTNEDSVIYMLDELIIVGPTENVERCLDKIY